MLFIMEGGKDVVDSDFQGIQINFALPRRFCQFLRGGARPAFCGGRAGRGAHPCSIYVKFWSNDPVILPSCKSLFFGQRY